MGQTNRNSKNGCATRLNYKKVKYPQTLLLKVHYETSVPYGQDRLIPIWLATLALQQKSPTLHFDSPSQLLDYFRLRKDGSQYRRMKVAFQRVFAATIFFGTEDQLKKHLVVDWSRFHFFDEMQLWFNREEGVQPATRETPSNIVVLSDAFYRELAEHPIPVERDGVAALAHAPGLLDFYIWMTWKTWTVNGQPARVPLFGPNGLTHQLEAICSRAALPAQDHSVDQPRQAPLAGVPCLHLR